MTVAAGRADGPPPRWRRVLRGVSACLIGLGIGGGVASAALYWTRADPTVVDLVAVADELVPRALIGETELRSVNDAVDAGPNERRATLDPDVSLDDVERRAEAAGATVQRGSSDRVVVDVGAFVAQVEPTRLDVVRDDRLTAAALVGLGGVLGSVLAGARSLRRSRFGARGDPARLLASAFLSPLGLLFGVLWGIAVSAPTRLTEPVEMGGAIIGVTILLAGFWVPVGVVAAFFAWLASRARG